MTNENYIPRKQLKQLQKKVRPGKVTMILGARRTGKTALIKEFLKDWSAQKYLLLNGEDLQTQAMLQERNEENYRRIISRRTLLVIDEAQKVPQIGSHLKFMVDSFSHLSVLVTGSSIFDLHQKLGEPLVGRSQSLYLYPLAQLELKAQENYQQTQQKLEERLIMGSYPEVNSVDDWEDKADYLEELVNSYLLRDLLTFQGIRKAEKLLDLLRLLAHQIGGEVSIDELARSLSNISRNTVEHYLDLLSKVFVIYKVRGYSGNLRNEITKNPRWYFYDNGIRNALIRNFNPLKFRADQGMLWENHLMSERLKYLDYHHKRVNRYFWRTYAQQEIDLVEEESGTLRAYEFKWNPRKKITAPSAWRKHYARASFQVIHPQNHEDFIT